MFKILFPTDFSPIANNAFVYALELAYKLNASISTLHVYDRPDITGTSMPKMLDDIYKSIEFENFENYRDSIPLLREIAEKAGRTDIELYHNLEEGEVLEELKKYADSGKYDMIVMGTKGATGLREVFLGSNTAKLMQQIDIPILSVPDEAIFDGDINNLLFTTAYEESEYTGFKIVQSFARMLDAKVHCVHFDVNHTESMTHFMDEWASGVEVDTDRVVFEVIDTTNIEKAMTDYCAQHQIDIITMFTRKRSFFERLFNYSLTRDAINHLSIPLFAVKEDNQDVEENSTQA